MTRCASCPASRAAFVNARAITRCPPSTAGGLEVTIARTLIGRQKEKGKGRLLPLAFEDTCRDANGDRRVRDVAAHDRAGANNRSRANRDAVQNLRPGSQP